MALLLRLGSHFWANDYDQTQAKMKLMDYVDDLADFTAQEVDIACRNWRRNAENKRFPRSSEIVASVSADRERRAKPVIYGPATVADTGALKAELDAWVKEIAKEPLHGHWLGVWGKGRESIARNGYVDPAIIARIVPK